MDLEHAVLVLLLLLLERKVLLELKLSQLLLGYELVLVLGLLVKWLGWLLRLRIILVCLVHDDRMSWFLDHIINPNHP